MNADAFFLMGKSHAVCQDYALAGPFKYPDHHLTGDPFIVVSDGCSSAPDTDFGSRFLGRAGVEFITRDMTGEAFARSAITTAYACSRACGLHPDCLQATLIAAVKRLDFVVNYVCGDGVVVARERESGRLVVKSYEFPSGAPFYLRYTLDPARVTAYEDQFGAKCVVTSVNIEPTGVRSPPETVEYTDLDEILCLSNFWPMRQFDLVALLSDGVRSFVKPVDSKTSKQTESVDYIDVVCELMRFKNYGGSFVQRRVRRAFDPMLGKFAQQGWVNTDDLSMAAIHVE